MRYTSRCTQVVVAIASFVFMAGANVPATPTLRPLLDGSIQWLTDAQRFGRDADRAMLLKEADELRQSGELARLTPEQRDLVYVAVASTVLHDGSPLGTPHIAGSDQWSIVSKGLQTGGAATRAFIAGRLGAVSDGLRPYAIAELTTRLREDETWEVVNNSFVALYQLGELPPDTIATLRELWMEPEKVNPGVLKSVREQKPDDWGFPAGHPFAVKSPEIQLRSGAGGLVLARTSDLRGDLEKLMALEEPLRTAMFEPALMVLDNPGAAFYAADAESQRMYLEFIIAGLDRSAKAKTEVCCPGLLSRPLRYDGVPASVRQWYRTELEELVTSNPETPWMDRVREALMPPPRAIDAPNES